MLCSDTRTITQCLVHFDGTNLVRPLAMPHFCLHLKSLRRSKLVCRLRNISFKLLVKINLYSPAWDKLESEISVFTLAHRTKLGWDN